MKTIRHLSVSLAWLAATFFSLSAIAQPASEGTITYIVNDLLGSPVVAMDQSGAVIWREAYSGYGERKNQPADTAQSLRAANKVWYTSRHQDEDTGLVYMGARYYDPALGRFLSVDSVHFVETNSHSFNRYAYANNNPYRFKDPDGRTTVLAARIVGQGAYMVATRLGAATLGGFIAQGAGDFRDYIISNSADNKGSDDDGKAGINAGENKGSAGGSRAGKPFTPKGRAEIDAENAAQNGGVNVCVDCGQEVVPGKKSESGVRPPGNERQRDHIVPQSKNGDGSPSNGQVLCRDCNRIKSDN